MGPGKWYTYENAPRHTFEKNYSGHIFVTAQVLHIAFEGFHVVEDNGDIRLVSRWTKLNYNFTAKPQRTQRNPPGKGLSLSCISCISW